MSSFSYSSLTLTMRSKISASDSCMCWASWCITSTFSLLIRSMSDESRRGEVDREADFGVPALVEDDSMIGGSREAALLLGGDDMLRVVC